MTKKKAAPKRTSAIKKKAAPKPRYYGRGKSDDPDPMDVHVGARVRHRRSIVGMTQTNLGKALGLTFQQIQKYERGSNRVSASRLYSLSKVLNVSVSYFFEEFNENMPHRAYGFSDNAQEDFSWLEKDEGDLMQNKETIELVRMYYQVQDPAVRKNFLKMLKAFVASQG